MADFTITLAKTYFRQLDNDPNTQTDDDYDKYLTDALRPAKNKFRKEMGNSNYLSYVNTLDDIVIISQEETSTTSHSFVYDNSLTTIEVGDIIVLADSEREIINVQDTSTTGQGKVTFQGSRSGSDTTFKLKSMEVMQSYFAWLVVYYFTFTAFDLLVGEITAESKEYGDGTIISATDYINKYREEILRNANEDKGAIGDLITTGYNIEQTYRI